MDRRKYSPVRAEMNSVVMNAVELGLFVKWSQEQLPMEAFLDYNGLQIYDEKMPMNFRQLSLMLLFCAAGLALGVVIFVLESFRLRGNKKRLNQ